MVKGVELKNSKGLTLRGILQIPDQDWNGMIVAMFHGFTGNKTEHAYHFRNFARKACDNGIATVRFDYSGNFESDGEFADMTFATLIEETNLILDFAKSVEGVKELIALGYSMGGSLAAYCSARRNDVDKMILWNPAGNMDVLIKTRYESGTPDEKGEVAFAPLFHLSKEMYETAGWYHPYEGLTAYKNPVIIISGLKDQSVPHEYAARYALCFQGSFLHLVQTAGHGFDSPAEAQEVYEKSISFLKRDFKI